MIIKEKDGLKWLEFELLQPFKEIQHGILMRHGGVSSTPCDSLNLNIGQKECSNDVLLNLSKVKETLSLSHLVYAKQVHQTQIVEINHSNKASSFECDGFITRDPNISLLIKHADCQAALFYDPKKKVIANVHCGWRGNVLNIYKEVIDKMKEAHGCQLENIHVGISPSLGPQNAEFKNYRTELPKSFWPFQIKPNYFDLWEIAKDQLVKEGISPSHIEIAKICTYNTQDFFSYRREKETGRNGSFIGLQEQS